MNSPTNHAPLEQQIAQWREFLRRRAAIHGTDVDELEDHLRNQVDALTGQGLAPDEAFLVAVKRMGNLDALSREFAREHSERLWKQLVLPAESGSQGSTRADVVTVLLLALAAAAAVKLPALFGLEMTDANAFRYLRNASLFVLPLLAGYFAWRRSLGLVGGMWVALSFAAAAVFANVYPFDAQDDTHWLSVLHLPIALWLVVAFAYVGGQWLANPRRMDFVRFSGELAIYYVLIALGGAVLTGFTVMLFNVIGVNPGEFVGLWLVPCGAAGAVIVSAWLVEAKQSVIENMAPVLTKLFTPLFTAILLAFLVTMVWTGNPINIQREVLIGFDLLLALVVGLVLYAASARDPRAPPGIFDVLQLLLIASAVAADVVALVSIVARISEFGFTPNRVAALGENLILLANLAGSAWFHVRFLRGQASFDVIERWQIAFLPVYGLWAAFVVIAFPPLFGFR
jgi:hypothetical protein